MKILPSRPRKDDPKIVAVGGGTGLSTILRGLKLYTSNITAVVTVADDGGSSGRLRKDLGILPPGDIRNCILALANVEPAMEQLFEYRFKEGSLRGQSLGNLLIAAMADISNGLIPALERIGNVLAITGRVYPVSLADMSLQAVLKDGTIIQGESRIPLVQMQRNSPIRSVSTNPAKCEALSEVLESIENADAIILGPGSLYTSIIPNLLVNGISQAIRKSSAVKLYVLNIMTQPGETTGYSATDHVKAIFEHGGSGIIDLILINNKKMPEEIINKYRMEKSLPVGYDNHELMKLGIDVVEADLADFSSSFIRHNAKELARIIMDLVKAR